MSDNPDLFWHVNIGDYLRDTQHLNAEEHGAYLLLLMHYWIRGPLPDDHDRLAMISRCSSNAWSNAQASVLAFFEHKNGRYHHKRVDRDRSRAVERMQKAAAKAKAAAEARWSRSGTPKSEGNTPPKNATSNATSMPEALHEDVLEECPTETETETIDSVAKATDADPFENPEKLLFDRGIAFLTSNGSTEPKARQMIGKWKQQFGTTETIVALSAAMRAGASDPIPYVTACLNRRAQDDTRPSIENERQKIRDPILRDVFDRYTAALADQS